MKNILCLMLTIGVLFSACKKEEDNNNSNTTTYPFSCKLGGTDFHDNPQASVNSSDVLIIDATYNTNTIRLTLPFFSQRNTGDTIQFSLPGMGVVTQDNITYSNIFNPPGEINITELNTIDGTISATFEFRANELENFQHVMVTEGKLNKVNF